MSILFCKSCSTVIDPQEDDYTTDVDDDKAYCKDCYDQNPTKCEENFVDTERCTCGKHTICRAEPDVGIFNNYLV